MAKNLVIVESPAKARTVGRYLGNDYAVLASMGHVRDLPQKTLGVDLDKDFEPSYEVPKDKQKVIREIRQNSKDATTIYLATDPDREGEAIAWHLVHSAGLSRRPLRRVVFHEITEKAINEAFQQSRDIDINLVNAQQTRRILDRLVGYKLSPLLWQKVVHHYARTKSLSAGRVQSVALRLVADRERDIQAFVPVEYWSIEAELEKASEPVGSFKASLHSVQDEKKKLGISGEAEAMGLVENLEGATYRVAQVKKRQIKQRPAAPFITSSLQQEAWRKLRFPARKTMQLAQQLYEGLPVGDEGSVGLITYMRTDSTNLSSQALQETLAYVRKRYGSEYAPKSPRVYTTKSKRAQEAHEAIRPTSVLRGPDELTPYLSREQRRLYELIWKRMVASQMADALLDSTSLDISASTLSGPTYLFKASGSVLKFPGFRVVYLEDQDDSSLDGEQRNLPDLKERDALGCLGVDPRQHFTQPPPRYTDASLIKTLEEEGIGRPSTYAPIISTIQDREYVSKADGRFKITPLGSVVCDLLIHNFPDIMNASFTAQMEEELDDIASGQREWVPVLGEFYGGFSKSIDDALNVPKMKVPEELTDQACELCGKPMSVKMGRFGRFLSCTGFPECRNSKPYQVPTGVICPRCGGDMVQRRGKKRGMVFYGCSNYPTCDFSVRQRPLPEPCPDCDELLVAAGRNGARCTVCEYRGAIPESESEPEPAEVAV
ncbi:MAG: type I DNA topoisomerase [Dehalococcoidia bacterium]|nr:type I DNA topoisomerase [Dehalococcoidia bacterium]